MTNTKKLSRVLFGLVVLGAGVYAVADNLDKPKSTRVAHITAQKAPPRPLADLPAALERDTYVLAAAPGGRYAEQTAIYQPIAEFLSQITGKRFVYRYTDNWLSYSRDLTGGAYDVVFDSAASTSWRIERIEHTPLVRLPDPLVFVVIARADDAKIAQLKQLAGYPVCAPLPPAVATLTLLSRFDNPARQPVIVDSHEAEEVYQGLLAGKCRGGVVVQSSLDKFDRSKVKVLYQHRALPNHAFSAGPRLSPELKAKIRDGLLSPAGHVATARLRAIHDNKHWVAASDTEYAGLAVLLKDSLYYY